MDERENNIIHLSDHIKEAAHTPRIRLLSRKLESLGVSADQAAKAFSKIPEPTEEEISMLENEIRLREQRLPWFKKVLRFLFKNL